MSTLAKYKAPSLKGTPPSSTYIKHNNPVQEINDSFEELSGYAQEHPVTGGMPHLQLRVFGGALEGIVHWDGQLQDIVESTDPQEVTLKEEQSKALVNDLDFLLELREETKEVLYGAWGSESDYSLLPCIFTLPHKEGASGEQPLQLDLPLYMASLNIPAEEYEAFHEHKSFDTVDSYLRHMDEKHINSSGDDPTHNVEEKKHFLAAVTKFANYVQTPIYEVMLGNEEGFGNPKPVTWVGLSPGGNIVGLLSAVVWT